MSDMDSIYMGRDPSETGNRINYNYFHHIINTHSGGHGVQALFFDDFSIFGAEVEGNVFYQTGSSGVIKFYRGGGVSIRNNIFVDCPKPLLLAGVRGQAERTKRLVNFMRNHELGQERLCQRVDITAEPYASRYPLLLAIYQGEKPLTTPFVRNYTVKGNDGQ